MTQMIGDLIQPLQDHFIVIAALPPRIQSLFDAARQLTGLLHQFSGRGSGATSARAAIRPTALEPIQLLGGGPQSLCQLLNENVLRTHLVRERGDLQCSGLLGLRWG